MIVNVGFTIEHVQTVHMGFAALGSQRHIEIVANHCAVQRNGDRLKQTVRRLVYVGVAGMVRFRAFVLNLMVVRYGVFLHPQFGSRVVVRGLVAELVKRFGKGCLTISL